MKITSSLFVFTMCLSAVLSAQPKKVIADKIVAQVGDKIILRSDIYNSIQDAERQGTPLPPSPECMLVERALIEKALVLQAERDSLPVSDEELEASLDNQIRGL
jgi:peptidyl-prolyl cis-trans isomerase SurA